MKFRAAIAFFLLVPGYVLAQLPSGGPAAPAAPKKPALVRDARARYILKQLDLSTEQNAQAEGLVDSFFKGEPASQDDIIARVRALSEEYKKAQEANDKKRMDEIAAELRNAGQGTVDEPQFLMNLRNILNDAQKAELENVLERLRSNPAGGGRPIDVYRAAVRLGLSAEQTKTMEETLAAFREQVMQTPPARDPAGIDLQRDQFLDELSAKIKVVLKPEQAAKFEKSVSALKVDSAKPAVPTSGPAKP
ncbi:MAG: hypothetical protein HZB38_07655 [Planctomycetes bacterium]|nr:hypothetical protein [Planctomycetota bacterium]